MNTIVASANRQRENLPGVLILSASCTVSGDTKISRSAPIEPPMADASVACPIAWAPFPWSIIACPSIHVIADAGAPGIAIVTAVIDPE